MRDIGRKIQRYRLSRYAATKRSIPFVWVWLGLGAWALWAGFISDHSFFHLWQLERLSAHEQANLERVRAERLKLDHVTGDKQARLKAAERDLRERDGYSRPTEIIYRIDDENDGGPEASKP